jgi:hypothetical protein
LTSKIVKFYNGDGIDDVGRTFEDVLALDDVEFEKCHNFIQWIFPLPEPSMAQPQSPVLTEEDIKIIASTQELKDRAIRARERYSLFLDNTNLWHRFYDHNHLRITRAIRFLTLIELPDEAKRLYNQAIDGAKAGTRTEWYWKEAMHKHPAWLIKTT